MIRLHHLPTLRIQPGTRVPFTYRRSAVDGCGGDTVASALFAAGVRIFSRSLKYHRPRGLYSLDGECANTLMQIDGVPNVNAELTGLREGMRVSPQNVVGTPEHDAMGFMNALSPAMPAGFHYRVFHKPARIWPLAIRRIRKAAGVGTLAPDFQMPGRFDEIYPAADVCVIGGGPAGMSAALTAADEGLRVVLMEARPWLGGAFEYRVRPDPNGVPFFERARQMAEKVMAHPSIRCFVQAPVIGLYANGLVTGFQAGAPDKGFDERYIEVRVRAVVVATGCIERPLLFDHNERPGVMQAGCAHRLARTWGILPGTEAVVSVGHDLGLEAAVDLFDLGVRLAAVTDIREDGQDPWVLAELEKRNMPLMRGWMAQKAEGGKQVTRVRLTSGNGRFQRTVPCDLVIASAGLTPVTGPFALLQAKLAFDVHTGYFLPRRLPEGVFAAGRLLGLCAIESVTASGEIAGLEAARRCGRAVEARLPAARCNLDAGPAPVRGTKVTLVPGAGKKAFICFDEDVTVQNIDQSMTLGFDVPELIKRFSSTGTGPGQSGISGHNLPLYVDQSGLSPDQAPRPTTARAPLRATLMATYAGAHHAMIKCTPLHDIQVAAGGRMERVGDWQRARRFSDDAGCRDEIRNVRTNVGVLDASTLGKFRIFGPDALKALQRVYVSDMGRLTPGKARYSAMCNDDGCLADDGVIVKTGENDYFFTTSTGRAGVTAEWIRYHTRHDPWQFSIVNLTDAFGVINLAGPKARQILAGLVDLDISNEAFPYMGCRDALLKGVPIRMMRLGFVGELSYELHVPASFMPAVWDRVMDAGRELGIRPFGLEAQNVLRLEKAHLIIGSESEQRTTLHDVGLGFLWHRNKPESQTVGDAALRHTENQKGRLKLVGLNMEDAAAGCPQDGSPIVDQRIRGYVCTARFSQALNAPIAMALVDDDLAGVGQRVSIYPVDCQGRLVWARVVPTPFYDPQGVRLHG